MQNNNAKRTAVIVPAYCPNEQLTVYVAALSKAMIGKIIIVDDGSGDTYQHYFDALPQHDGVVLLSYFPNAGKGVALKRGLAYVQESCKEIDFIITADSDGQHTVTDVLRMVESLASDAQGLLLGVRDFSQGNVPPKSRIGNRITTAVFKVLYGSWIPDTQTGLRGFSRDMIPLLLGVRGDRYEYEMNMLITVTNKKIPVRSLTIETVYENNNAGTHFRAIRDSARIYGVILRGFFSFIGTSVIGFGFDYVVFLFLNSFMKQQRLFEYEFQFFIFTTLMRILVATIVARMISGVINYLLNRKFVFDSQSPMRQSFLKYLCVFALIMVLSAVFTSSLHLAFGWNENLAKILVDVSLFFVSYYLQKHWVFCKKVYK